MCTVVTLKNPPSCLEPSVVIQNQALIGRQCTQKETLYSNFLQTDMSNVSTDQPCVLTLFFSKGNAKLQIGTEFSKMSSSLFGTIKIIYSESQAVFQVDILEDPTAFQNIKFGNLNAT